MSSIESGSNWKIWLREINGAFLDGFVEAIPPVRTPRLYEPVAGTWWLDTAIRWRSGAHTG